MVNTKITPQLINPQALEVCKILSNEGYQSFIVGGCVRDLLLGIIPKDWDITTDATPQQVMKLFPKTIPTGLQHGTVTVVMGEGVAHHFEVTTFRIEGNYIDGRRPEEVFFVQNVEQDLARRDLTINAIAYDPITQYLIDPYSGIIDLKSKMIRAVGSAKARFQEDGLRIMRAARFAARFGYDIHVDTFQGMRDTISTLAMISKERVQDEICKTLMTDRPTHGMHLLLQCGALAVACPYLTSNEVFLFNIAHLDACKGELETRLAVLYGDVSPVQAQEELLSLKFATKQIKRIVFLLDLLAKYETFSSKGTVLAYKSFMAIVKNHAPDPWEGTLEQFILFSEALGLNSRAMLAAFQNETVFAKQDMHINGHDLIQLGLLPGPNIKSILEACYLEILRNPENNNKQFLLELAATRLGALVTA